MYAQTIDAALLKLAQYPDFGREINDVCNGAKSFPVEKQIVFYQINYATSMLLVFFISAWIPQSTFNHILVRLSSC